MLYHGLIVIGTSAILLLIYNLIIVRWCANRHSAHRRTDNTSRVEALKTFDSNQGISMMLPSYKYKKEHDGQEDQCDDDQCAVCLSFFEDEEDLKCLPRCKHSFHSQCIDMWLYSHLDCPICRTKVQPPISAQPNETSTPAAHARQVMDPENMV